MLATRPYKTNPAVTAPAISNAARLSAVILIIFLFEILFVSDIFHHPDQIIARKSEDNLKKERRER